MDTDQTSYHVATGRELTRRNVEAAIAKATLPVKFVDCDLQGVDLSRLDLTGFAFERCNLIEADLRHATAMRTQWRGCRARRAKVDGADMTDASFRSGDWNNASWTGAILAGAAYVGVKLTGGDFTNSKSIGTTFEDCPMQSCDVRGLSFRRARMGRCDLSNANLCAVDLREAAFDAGSSIVGARISDARFDGADLREVDISGHGLQSLQTLRGARISIQQAAEMVKSAGLKVG